MKPKTYDELINDYWMRFLKTGSVTDYLAFKRFKEKNFVDVEFGEEYDINKQTTSNGDNHQEK